MLPLCDSFGENAVPPSTCSGNFLPKKTCTWSCGVRALKWRYRRLARKPIGGRDAYQFRERARQLGVECV